MRNLSAAQIVEQLVEARRLLQETPDAGAATNIVFMGMGAARLGPSTHHLHQRTRLSMTSTLFACLCCMGLDCTASGGSTVSTSASFSGMLKWRACANA